MYNDIEYSENSYLNNISFNEFKSLFSEDEYNIVKDFFISTDNLIKLSNESPEEFKFIKKIIKNKQPIKSLNNIDIYTDKNVGYYLYLKKEDIFIWNN